MTITKMKNKYIVESLTEDGEFKYVFFTTIKQARQYARELERDFFDTDIAIYKLEGYVN